MKRDVLARQVRSMPVPSASPGDIEGVAWAARRYLETAQAEDSVLRSDALDLPEFLLQLDAEVLRLYELPVRLERQVLDLFTGQQRVGVNFSFTEYFPADFEPCFSLHEYLSDEYRRSTAGAMRSAHQDVTSAELLSAMRRAVEDFEE